jgi:acyl-coenzyme A synthetase/AMP-(fatty) acid ligase
VICGDDVVYLRGRASDQINVAGRQGAPASIEKALMEHPALTLFGSVRRVAMAIVPIDRACVGLSRPSGKTLRRFMLGRVPAWQMPRDWWFVDSLATNRLGKISRVEWRRRYLEAKNSNAAIPGISSDSVS